jgi:hypothetical protein
MDSEDCIRASVVSDEKFQVTVVNSPALMLGIELRDNVNPASPNGFRVSTQGDPWR